MNMPSEVNFIQRTYASFTEFEKALDEFQKKNFCVFRKKSTDLAEKANSKTKAQIPEGFKYARCFYVCTHFGPPVYRGKGAKSKTKHSATGCEAKFTLNFDYRDGVLRINKCNLVHNHPTAPETFSREYKVKRLTAGQREELKEIVSLDPRNENLLRLLKAKYGKALSLKDVRHLKSELKSDGIGGEVDVLLTNLQDVELHGKVRLQLSQNASQEAVVDIVAFSTYDMISCYNSFPEVLYMDGTYKKNRSGFPLYQIMVEDSNGVGRPVFYAFVRMETTQMLTSVLEIFNSFVDNTEGTKLFMTDKDMSEISAVRNTMPHTKNLLCTFHVVRAMKQKIWKLPLPQADKNRLCGLAYRLIMCHDEHTFCSYKAKIASVSENFSLYMEDNWYSCVGMWAHCHRLCLPTFLNDTNNKCEGEHKKLKEILNSNTSVGSAVKLLFQHARVQHGEVLHATCMATVSSHYFRDASTSLTSLYEHFTPYAVQLMVEDHKSFQEAAVVGAGFSVQDESGLVFTVSGHPLQCTCPFTLQTTLPCRHVVKLMIERDLPLYVIPLANSPSRTLKKHCNSPLSSHVRLVIKYGYVT